MKREEKKIQFEKGYYKTHSCNKSFTCKYCGWIVTPQGAGSDHRNHCQTVCILFIWISNQVTGNQIVEESWNQFLFGSDGKESGQFFIDVSDAEPSIQIVSPLMTIQ